MNKFTIQDLTPRSTTPRSTIGMKVLKTKSKLSFRSRASLSALEGELSNE